jgi:hypothetical protein
MRLFRFSIATLMGLVLRFLHRALASRGRVDCEADCLADSGRVARHFRGAHPDIPASVHGTRTGWSAAFGVVSNPPRRNHIRAREGIIRELMITLPAAQADDR